MIRRLLGASLLLGLTASLAACSDHPLGTFSDLPDSGPVDEDADQPDAPMVFKPDATTPDAAVPTGFFLLATETPYAPAADGSNWGGVARFNVSGDYEVASAVPGLKKSTKAPLLVADPAGLAFRWKTAEVFIANRGGNLSGQSSISSFPYDAQNQTFGTGSLVVSGFSGFHQLAFNPAEDEIFVGTNNEGMRRFKLSGSTWVEQLPQLVGSPDWIRGVAVSPDGKRLYASTAGSVIRQWDLTTNQELAMYTLQDTTAGLHFMTLCGPAIGNLTTGCSPAQLYVSDSPASGQRAVYRFDINPADDSLTNETKIDADPTFNVALSPDGKELFSGESAANKVQRFKPSGSSWAPEVSFVSTMNNIGTILIFPTNAVPTVLH